MKTATTAKPVKSARKSPAKAHQTRKSDADALADWKRKEKDGNDILRLLQSLKHVL